MKVQLFAETGIFSLVVGVMCVSRRSGRSGTDSLMALFGLSGEGLGDYVDSLGAVVIVEQHMV